MRLTVLRFSVGFNMNDVYMKQHIYDTNKYLFYK